MASPFSALPGAVSTVSDEVVEDGSPGSAPLHYGEPVREQRRLADGSAVVHLGDRSVVAVAGPDRLTWLDSITSQLVAHLAPGSSTELLILDPHGHIEHEASVFDDGETTWLIADEADAPGLAGWLKKMVFRSQVTVAERGELAVVGYVAGGSADLAVASAALRPAGVPVVWVDPWVAVVPGGHQYSAVAEHPGAAREWREAIVDADELDGLAGAIAASPETLHAAGSLAAEALRLEAWRPRWAREVDERSLPHELDWLRTAVHLNKGCYRGQETVAKVHNLGHPPRRLVFLHLDGSDAQLPEPGAPVRLGDAEVGRVTSSARHHELGPIALAIVKRTLPVDAAVTVDVEGGSVAAAQDVIVPPEAGAEASVPRLPRLSTRR